MVVTAVMVVVTTMILADNNRFGGVVLLENLAYDVALSVREAQVYGISVQRFGGSNFDAGFGVHFDISSPQTYVVFGDGITPNGLYDCPQPGTSDCELVQATTISNGYRIGDLCVTPPSGTETCGAAKVDVLFQRPEPDASISLGENSCLLNGGLCEGRARVILVSPRGDTMSVIVESNGQISVRR